MLATSLTLALFGVAIATIIQLLRSNGQKIMAALKGQSWIAAPPAPVRPVTVRFSQRYPAMRPMRAQPEWRVAA